LLGLLAQQELEMTVFRKTLEKTLGSRDLQVIEDRARQVVAHKYGSYTDYRSNIDMGNFEVDGI
jgi:hypothetical protein